MVSLTLVIARITKVLEVEALGSNSLNNRRSVGPNTYTTQNGSTDLHAILLFDLRTHLLSRMTGHSVGNLMTKDDSE